jgi:hypothetical protein
MFQQFVEPGMENVGIGRDRVRWLGDPFGLPLVQPTVAPRRYPVPGGP